MLGTVHYLQYYTEQRYKNKKRESVLCWTATILESEDFYNAFSRWYNPIDIIEKAKSKTLTFDDIIDEYENSLKFKIFAFGIDSMTGVEKMFESPEYTAEDIRIGKYNPAHEKKSLIKNMLIIFYLLMSLSKNILFIWSPEVSPLMKSNTMSLTIL